MTINQKIDNILFKCNKIITNLSGFKVRIAVFGAGGIGGYFGARLAQAGNDVALVARGAHLQAIQANGLFVKSSTGDFHIAPYVATNSLAEVGVVDLVILGIKAWDVSEASE